MVTQGNTFFITVAQKKVHKYPKAKRTIPQICREKAFTQIPKMSYFLIKVSCPTYNGEMRAGYSCVSPRIKARSQAAISLRLRSSFSNVIYTSLGANFPSKSFSETVPRPSSNVTIYTTPSPFLLNSFELNCLPVTGSGNSNTKDGRTAGF